MAVQEQTPLQEYTANGIAKQFDLEFDCESADHLIVSIDDLEVLHTDWYLSGNAIIFHVAPANGTQVKIQRNTPFNRLADYQSYNNSFRPPAINKDLDRIWWKLQELGVADWILSSRISALKAYVDDRDDELRAYLMEEIRKQGVALDQLDEYYNYLMERLAQIAIDKGWEASFVVSAGGDNQQEINDRGGSYWREKPLGYDIDSRVMLENGDIVRSTVAGNTVNPNADMTGWFNETGIQKKLLSHYGAIPNNILFAEHNEECLIRAIKDGYVCVDGHYYIECNSTEVISNSFTITSPDSARGVIEFTNAPTAGWLKLDSIEYIDTLSVDIKSPLDQRATIFTVAHDLVSIDRFKIDNCNISSQSRYFYATFSSTVDPSVTRYGIKNVHIIDSEFDNPNSIFFTVNMPHDFVEVKRNNVKNLTGRFFNISIGTHSFEQKLKDMSLLSECSGNTVRNDLGFLATGVIGYLTFFLYESGGHLEYTNNIVSGLATKEKVVVYDCYANTKTLKHESNTWRNNLCMHIDKWANTLLKSKSAIKAEYFNNKFYVDTEFLAHHNAFDQSVVQIYSVDSTTATNDRQCIMRENTFDVYHLIGQTTTQATKNIVFEYNKIRAFNVTGFLFSVRRNASGITDLSDAKIRIKRNDIDAKNLGMDVTVFSENVGGFGLVAMSTAPSDFGRYKEISVAGNTIKAKTAHNTVFFYSILEADYIDISNNEIEIEELATVSNFIPYDFNTFIYDDLKANNCMIKAKGSTVIPARSTAGNLTGDGKASYSVVLDALFNGQVISVKKPVASSSFVKVQLNSLSIAGSQSASYLLKLTPSAIEYLASDNTQKTVNYPTSGSTNITDLKVFKIQEVNTLMLNLSLTLSALRGDVTINLQHSGLASNTKEAHYSASVDVLPI